MCVFFFLSLLVAGVFGQNYQAQIYRSRQTNNELFTDLGQVPVRNGNGNGITVNINQKYQEIIGFGGAFTETSAYNFALLDDAKKKEVAALLFDNKTGIGMSVCRTHINSADFSVEEYTYVTNDDKNLGTFDLGQDRKWVLPMIKAAYAVQGDNLYLFGSPWSPPAFMKDTNKMENGGNLKADYYDSWALYFVKYIQEYAKEGIPFWGVTVQNEPAATQTWESCRYTGQQEGQFAANNLRPALDKAGLDYIKIQVWDHNRDMTQSRADESYGVNGAKQAIWGVANHWYGGDHWDALDNVHEKYPDHFLTTTEFCRGGDSTRNTWEDMDAYAHEIVGGLNHWVVAITDWNMIVDQEGGPYHNRDGSWRARAPITVNNGTRDYSVGYIYWSIGHFSKFIQRGSVRVGTTLNNLSNVEATAALNPDGTIAVVVLNRGTDNHQTNLKVGDAVAPVEIAGHSLTSFILTPA